MEIQSLQDNSLFLNSIEFIEFNKNIIKCKLFINFNNHEYIIHATLKTLDDIRLISYDEFCFFSKIFVGLEDRNQYLDNLFKIIWNFIDNKNSITFPVRII